MSLEKIRKKLKKIENLLINLLEYRSHFKQNLNSYNSYDFFIDNKKYKLFLESINKSRSNQFFYNKKYFEDINKEIINHYFEVIIPNICTENTDEEEDETKLIDLQITHF